MYGVNTDALMSDSGTYPDLKHSCIRSSAEDLYMGTLNNGTHAVNQLIVIFFAAVILISVYVRNGIKDNMEMRIGSIFVLCHNYLINSSDTLIGHQTLKNRETIGKLFVKFPTPKLCKSNNFALGTVR